MTAFCVPFPPHKLSCRPGGRWLARALAALALWGAAGAFAADDPRYGGTFDTPGYPQAGGQGSGGLQGGGGAGTPGYPGGGGIPGGRAVQGGAQGAPQPGSPALRNNGNVPPGTDPSGLLQQQPLRRSDFPPPRPSEFQKFVEAATGRMLPIFGAPFFEAGREGFQGLDNVPVTADYVVGPGDELIVRAWGSIDVDFRTTVDRNGQLNLPKVGSFSVAGVKASDLERHLRAQIGRLYTNFNLNVTLGNLRGLKVFVVGPARRPGVYTLPSQSTLLSAVVAAGGPGPNGSMRKLSLRRDGRVISELDVYEFLVQGDKSKDVQLAAGDVVVFQPAGARVALTGAIDTPAIYELKVREEPLRELLRYAGGASVIANPNQAQLERIDPTRPGAARFVEQFSLDASGLQKQLRDGDVLTLLQISPQFANAVTLRGHVAQPLRYAFQPGMRIRDLIPDKEALISPDFYRRKNLLVQVIEDDESLEPRLSQQDRNRDAPVTGVGSGMRADGSDDLRAPLGGDPRRRVQPGAGGIGQPQQQQSGTPRQGQVDPDQPREEERASVRRVRRAPTPLFDELNWDYAVIERLNRNDLTTQVIPFNLGAAILRGDPANNVELMPGDVVTVFSQKDIRGPVSRQTRLVSVEGEVGAPGVYQLLPGETLRGLIGRAGGFTPQAYVYGLEFSREETRQRQRENLESALARLQALSATQAARDAANRRDDGAASSTLVSNAATQAQLARLSRIEPNGRVALELRPQDSSLDTLPDVPLEHADRIIVPSRPGFITVAGAVLNNNAFLWRSDRSAGDYLKLAGVDEAGDISNMFILRADGTVDSAADRRGLFGFGGLQSARMQPGDALIVPNQLDYETWGRALVRNLKDWSQIFSQFGLGAAAIQTLRNN